MTLSTIVTGIPTSNTGAYAAMPAPTSAALHVIAKQMVAWPAAPGSRYWPQRPSRG